MALKRPAMVTTRSTAVTVGCALVVVSWGMAAAVEAYFDNGGFLRQLLLPRPGAIVLRLLFIAIQLLFILYIARIMSKYRQQEILLEEALQNAEQEKHRSQEVLEGVGDAISLQDINFRILYQNRAHQELMGVHIGEYCYEAYQHKDSVCPGCHLALSFQDGQPHRIETCAESKRGFIYSEIISTPLRDASGNIYAGIEAVRDITDRKLAEQEIQRMNGELERRAGELAEANRELEAFSYSLSHDLRSYITRICMAQQILGENEEAQDEQTRYLLKTIDEASHGMEELIESMLTLARLSTQEMRWEELSLSELAQEVFLLLRQQELARQVEFSAAPGVTVRADRHLLKVALHNLLANAFKYTRGVPVARLEFGVAERGGRRCYFVRDNGIGFDMAEKEKLFHPFQRLKGAENFPGSGVGLATVERALKRHGGEVWGEGEPGKGATFYFTLGE